MAKRIPVVPATEWLSRLAALRAGTANPSYIKAFYSSLVDAVTTDPALASVPIDDHMVHRGHAVFDTCTLANGRLYRLRTHLDRLLSSAVGAKITPPFGRDRMESIILQTAAASGMRDGSVRYWLGSGPGDFSFVPDACITSTFYCAVFEGSVVGQQPALGQPPPGVCDVTVRDVPLKPEALGSIKTNNYLLNCLTAMRARELGGTFGILIDEKGCIAESCVLNASFVIVSPDSTKTLVTPTFERALNGTTVRQIMALSASLVSLGVVDKVEQRRIPEQEARTAVEVFLTGGDTHVYAITKWDDRQVGDGQVGPVATAALSILEQEAWYGSSEHLDVPYPKAGE